jgi:hypothetical protein
MLAVTRNGAIIHPSQHATGDSNMNPAQIIANLKPGQERRISGNSLCWVTVERSGNGKTLRYVRHTPRGFEVILSVKF